MSFHSFAPRRLLALSNHPASSKINFPKNPTKQDNNLKRAMLISSFVFLWMGICSNRHSLFESICAKYLFTICSTFRRPRGRIVARDKYGFLQGNHCSGVPSMNKLCCFLSNDPHVSSNTIKAVVVTFYHFLHVVFCQCSLY